MWDKLKREWKTFVWGLVSILVEGAMFVDPAMLDPVIPDEWQPLVHFIIPVGFFALRKWKEDQDVRA